MYIIDMSLKYNSEKERIEAVKKNKRNSYYRRALKAGKTPKAVLLEQATKEKDLKELILGLKQDIAGLRELITAQARK
jgi:hypothetical protein